MVVIKVLLTCKIQVLLKVFHGAENIVVYVIITT